MKFSNFSIKAPIKVYGIEGRYAHALYSAASKKKNLEKVETELDQIKVNFIKGNIPVEKSSVRLQHQNNLSIFKFTSYCLLFVSGLHKLMNCA